MNWRILGFLIFQAAFLADTKSALTSEADFLERCSYPKDNSKYRSILCIDKALFDIESALILINQKEYEENWKLVFQKTCATETDDISSGDDKWKSLSCLATEMPKALVGLGGKIPESFVTNPRRVDKFPHPACIFSLVEGAAHKTEKHAGWTSVDISQCQLANNHVRYLLDSEQRRGYESRRVGYFSYKYVGNISNNSYVVQYYFKEGNYGDFSGVFVIRNGVGKNKNTLYGRELSTRGMNCSETPISVQIKGEKIQIIKNITVDDFLEKFGTIKPPPWQRSGENACFGTYAEIHENNISKIYISRVDIIGDFSQEYLEENYDGNIRSYFEQNPNALNDFSQCFDFMLDKHNLSGRVSHGKIRSFFRDLKGTCKGYSIIIKSDENR